MSLEKQVFKVRLTLTEALLGTIPKDAQLYTKFIKEKAKEKGIEVPEGELETIEDLEITGYTGFYTDKDGPFLYNYQVRGFLKEAANNLKEQLKVKNLRSKVNNFMFVEPRKIRLPEVEPEPFERPLRAMTQQGPRTALVKSDLVAPGHTLEFEVHLLPHKELNGKLLHTLLEYGQYQGLGQFRNGGFGRFSFELREA